MAVVARVKHQLRFDSEGRIRDTLQSVLLNPPYWTLNVCKTTACEAFCSPWHALFLFQALGHDFYVRLGSM